MLKTKNKHLRYVITFFAVLCSSLLQTFVIESFVHSAGLLSGGFTGVAILIDRAAWLYGGSISTSLALGALQSSCFCGILADVAAGGGALLPEHQPEIHAFFPSASRHDQLIPEILLSAADF